MRFDDSIYCRARNYTGWFGITGQGTIETRMRADLVLTKRGASGLWSIPVSSGEERQVLDSVTGMDWTVAATGIYYIDFDVESGAPKLAKVL